MEFLQSGKQRSVFSSVWRFGSSHNSSVDRIFDKGWQNADRVSISQRYFLGFPTVGRHEFSSIDLEVSLR
ncbi:MAG: hypothetical protein SWY16_10170 [Cyanobacteriota bacterium]|nr:hypothetical protein [Cyanobacteriota bacterium]